VLAGDDPDAPERARTPPREPRPAPAPAPPTGEGLAVGLTEQNPHLMWAPGERGTGAAPEPFARRAAELRALRPRYFRLIVDWSALQADPAAPADLARPETGCLRERGPCAGYDGLLERLRALAARQRDGGWETLVVPTWTPPWAAAAARGCERRDVDPRARPPRADQLGAYRALIRAILAAARRTGARLTYWSPWNEPNHPGFISPQRRRCADRAPTLAPRAYAAIAQAMRRELDAAPGDQRLVLGELAGLVTAKRTHTPVDEFIAALPRELVCSADLWSTHGYAGGEDPVDAVDGALRRHGCPMTLWITETGIPGTRRGACETLHERLERWHADDRVGVALNYTFRTDDRFPTGMVSTDLADDLPTLAVWRAWSARRPADPPPPSPCARAQAG
jgi:hypothetical protein